MWINKYKRSDWRYWYDTPERYVLEEIDKINSLINRHLSYLEIYNIDILGAIHKMYCLIYSRHKTKAKLIYDYLSIENKNKLPEFLKRYFC